MLLQVDGFIVDLLYLNEVSQSTFDNLSNTIKVVKARQRETNAINVLRDNMRVFAVSLHNHFFQFLSLLLLVISPLNCVIRVDNIALMIPIHGLDIRRNVLPNFGYVYRCGVLLDSVEHEIKGRVKVGLGPLQRYMILMISTTPKTCVGAVLVARIQELKEGPRRNQNKLEGG